MEIKVCNEISEVAPFVDAWCESNITDLGCRSLFLPAGNTVVPLYQRWEELRPDYLNDVELHQVDDVISGHKTGLFRKYFQDHLPSYQSQMIYLEKGSSKAEKSCDLAILGLGLNGHIAFHEPGMPIDFEFGELVLSKTTCDTLQVPDGTMGITYGAKSFLKCKKILLIVTGENKKGVLEKLRRQDSSLPATSLLNSPGFSIVADKAAFC